VAEFNPTPRRALRKADISHAAPTPNPLRARKGSSSADAVKKQKSVSVKVKVPKDLRKRLKSEAAELGISVDELIARRLG
jgi:hypothetical protein